MYSSFCQKHHPEYSFNQDWGLVQKRIKDRKQENPGYDALRCNHGRKSCARFGRLVFRTSGKKRNTGPFSNYIVKKLIESDTSFLGLKFYNQSFLYKFIDGEHEHFTTNNGHQVKCPIFCIFGINNLEKLPEDDILKILTEVYDQMEEWLESKDSKPDWKMPCFEPTKNIITKEYKTWNDVLSTNEAMFALIQLCDPPKRGLREPDPIDQDTWGKQNEEIVQTFFHENSLTKKQCSKLGLLQEKWMEE